jgi:uncharacterized membrane protein
VRAAVILYVAGLAILVIGLSSILVAGWLAALLVIAGITIFCAGIAAEERGYRVSESTSPRARISPPRRHPPGLRMRARRLRSGVRGT